MEDVDVSKNKEDNVTKEDVNELKDKEGNMTKEDVNKLKNKEGNVTKEDVNKFNEDKEFKIKEENPTKSDDNKDSYIEVVKCVTENSRLRVSRCAQYELKNERKIKFHLIQEIKKITVPAVRCMVRRTVHSWYCGTSSHLHLAAPTLIDESLLVTTEECTSMYVNRIFTMEGTSIPVFTHRAQAHNFLLTVQSFIPRIFCVV